MSATVMVTGGSGMVGRNLIERLRNANLPFVAPTRKELDLLDFDAVRRLVSEVSPGLVLHAAGRVGGIQANINSQDSFMLDNIAIGSNIIRACQEVGVPRLINLGSSCMYPRGYETPLTEDMVLSGFLEPTNEGYAISKIVTMKLCEYVTKAGRGLTYKTLIPCNIYGPYDKFDPINAHLIPAVIAKIHCAKASGAQEVVIWGDGKARREFMYAGDLADALVRAIAQFDSLPLVMNLGVGVDFSVDDYYQEVASVVGYRGRFVYDESRPTGMNRKLSSIERQLGWGWRSSVSLRDGIARTYEYFLQEIAS